MRCVLMVLCSACSGIPQPHASTLPTPARPPPLQMARIGSSDWPWTPTVKSPKASSPTAFPEAVHAQWGAAGGARGAEVRACVRVWTCRHRGNHPSVPSTPALAPVAHPPFLHACHAHTSPTPSTGPSTTHSLTLPHSPLFPATGCGPVQGHPLDRRRPPAVRGASRRRYRRRYSSSRRGPAEPGPAQLGSPEHRLAPSTRAERCGPGCALPEDGLAPRLARAFRGPRKPCGGQCLRRWRQRWWSTQQLCAPAALEPCQL